MELGNAGVKDPSCYEQRFDYCNDFCRVFPETDELMREGMKRAAAESCSALGRVGEGERAFAALAEEFPDSLYIYMIWGDMHAMPSISGGPSDYDKARRLYEKAHTVAKSDQDKRDAADRLRDLKMERRKQQ